MAILKLLDVEDKLVSVKHVVLLDALLMAAVFRVVEEMVVLQMDALLKHVR
jgi:hypothetical protein